MHKNLNYTNNLFKKSLKNYQNKDYSEAKKNLFEILNLDPTNIQALNFLGVIHGILKEHLYAKECFEKSLNLDPNQNQQKENLSISLYELEEYGEAIKLLNKIPVNQRISYQYYLNLGNCHFKLLNYVDAINNYEKSIRINSSNFQAYLNLGIINKINKDYDSSEVNLVAAFNLNKNNFLINFHLGDLCLQKKNFEPAIIYFKNSLIFDNANIDATEKLGLSYLETGKLDEAKNIFESLLSIDNLSLKERSLVNLSTLELRKNNDDFYADYTKAFEYAKSALNLNPLNFSALNNIGICYLYRSDFKNSIKNLKKAYDIDPTSLISLKNLSTAYNHIGLFDLAEETIKNLKKYHPNYKKMNMSLATALLSQSNFKEGWEYYEERWFLESGAPTPRDLPTFTKPRWEPEMGYDRILIWGEQGLGDQILHGTILNDFSHKFKEVYLAIDPRLAEIFTQSFPNIKVFGIFDDIKQDIFDYQIPLCSIAKYSRNSLESFLPLTNPFKKIFDKKERFNFYNPEKINCAITWKSVKGSKSDFKSMNLIDLKKILKIPDIDFYNIQYTDEEAEIQEIKGKYDINLFKPRDIDTKNDIYNLAHFISCCDFTISISNTNAHLSGAVGTPTYLLLSDAYGKIWYWDNMYEGKNVWYPTVKKFVQKEHRNWEHPVDELFNNLMNEYQL